MFVAINYITCTEDYRERFETFFKTRAKAIDNMPGFKYMEVLKPNDEESDYLIISHWESEKYFQNWTKSGAFMEGHRRGFSDLAAAKEKGEKPPMQSTFKTYNIIAE